MFHHLIRKVFLQIDLRIVFAKINIKVCQLILLITQEGNTYECIPREGEIFIYQYICTCAHVYIPLFTYINICIYRHQQSKCSISSELFSVVIQAGFTKRGSKPG